MVHFTGSSEKTSQPLHEMMQSMVLPVLQKRRPDRILLVSHDAAACAGMDQPGLTCIHNEAAVGGDTVRCSTREMPFQDGSFGAVILYHVFADGREPQFAEARRVLAPGGDLFVLGRGSLGFAEWTGRGGRHLPGLQARRVCRRLKRRSFTIERCAGKRLFGLGLNCTRRWQQPVVCFTDAVLIHGRHHQLRPVTRPLRYRHPRAVGVRTAAADHLSREAV